MTFGLETIDQLYYTVTQITTHWYNNNNSINEKPIDKGTGFFYRNLAKKKLFLITNRHVIQNENYANVARLNLHTDIGDLRNNNYYNLHLYDRSGSKMWIEPDPISADVIAIFIEEDLQKKGFFIKNFNTFNLLPRSIQLHLGEDVIIMGYPLGVSDQIHNLPILRIGIVASAYPIPFNGNPYFLVDSYLEKGTSGSPVITKFKDSWRNVDGSKPPSGFSFFLLGINSATFLVEDQQKPAELNAVYFASIIEKMTS